MAKRTIGAERLFSLGDYKNVRLIESMELDDDGMTDDDLDALRLMNMYNLYLGFAMHQMVLQDVKENGFDPQEVMRLVFSVRDNLEETIDTMKTFEELEENIDE